jgi:hypothetical protein
MSVLRWLLGIDEPSPDGARWSLALDALPGGDGLLLVVVLAVVVALGLAWLYHLERRRVHRTGRVVLTALRIAAVALVALMNAEPALVQTTQQTEPSNLLVLVDHSGSMRISDGYGQGPRAARLAEAAGLADADAVRGTARLDLATLVYERQVAEALSADGQRRLRVHPFAGGLLEQAEDEPAGTAAATQPDDPGNADAASGGAVTNIGSALRQLLLDYQGAPLAGVLLVSDGRSTVGPDPAQVASLAADQGVPIVSLAVGTPSGPVNAAVEAAEVDRYVFVRDQSVLRVFLRSRGAQGAEATLAVEHRLDGGPWRALHDQAVTLEGGGARQVVEVPFSFEQPATVDFRVRLETQLVEQTLEDNATLAQTRVVSQQLRVLLVAGLPFPEVQFLRNTLLRDPRIDASTWLQSADADYQQPGNTPIRRLPVSLEELDRFDAVILYDPDPSRWPSNFGPMLHDYVAQRGGGLVLVAGEQHTEGLFGRTGDPAVQWLDLMPVVREPNLFRTAVQMRLSQSEPYRLQITDAGMRDPVLAFDADPQRNRRLIGSLPGMFWHFPVTRAKPGATVLARHSHPSMRNQYGQEVLLATQLAGPGRTVFVGFDSTYRWRYLEEQLFDGFWARLVDRVGSAHRLGGLHPFRLSADRPEYQPGQTVTVTARFLDAQQADPSLTSLTAEVERGGDEPARLRLDRVDDTTFRGVFEASRPGQHLVRVWATDGPAEQGGRPNTMTLQVRLPDVEMADPSLDRSALIALASATGGRVLDLEQAAQVHEAFWIGEVTRRLEQREALWDAPLLWITLMGLLIAEWVLRKRWRLV